MVDNVIISPSSEETFGNYLHFEISKDMMKTWHVSEPIHSSIPYGTIQPTIFVQSNGRLVAYSRSDVGKIIKCISHDNGLIWGELTPTDISNPDSGIDGVSINNELHILVYNKSRYNRSNLTIAKSADLETWQDIITLEDGEGEYSYPSIIHNALNRIHIVYTYKRKNIKYVEIDIEGF